MAFKDITKVLYNGNVKLDYKDSNHAYYVRTRENWDLSPEDAKAWGKTSRPKGTTTLLGDTLEKSGLMNYSLNKAMMCLFGFYEFKDDNGERKIGYSKKGEQILWDNDNLKPLSRDEALEVLSYGSKASQRHTQKGADIGSVVHDAIEQYVLGHTNNPEIPSIESVFDIGEQYMWNIKEAITDINSPEYEQAMEDFPGDVEMAKQAFNQFVIWWEAKKPKLLGAEQIVYSMEHNYAGSFDGLIELDGKIILCDWKTSNASASESACSPNGVYYSYFIQSAMYAAALIEMGVVDHVDELMIVSCRKDGNFDTVTTADIGMDTQECIEWAVSVIKCFRFMDKAKTGLWAFGKATGRVVEKVQKTKEVK